jgi:hypothetical protein
MSNSTDAIPEALTFWMLATAERRSDSAAVPGELEVAVWRVMTRSLAVVTDPAQAVPDAAEQIVVKEVPPSIEYSTNRLADAPDVHRSDPTANASPIRSFLFIVLSRKIKSVQSSRLSPTERCNLETKS